MKSPLSSRVLQYYGKRASFDTILAFIKGVFLLRGIRGIMIEALGSYPYTEKFT